MKIDTENFRADVYNIVSQIPVGHVLTYGHIAMIMGYPAHARMVGQALKCAPQSMHLPCHRVVNAAGCTVAFWPEQIRLLQEEGVSMTQAGKVNLKKHLWRP